MAPIPIYNNSPITAAKPDGVTPKTASAADGACSSSGAASSLPTSTNISSPHGSSTATAAAARPGATPSLSTPTIPAAGQPYSPLQPTPTTSMAGISPAPPQPGSVPVSRLPPPPRAGERYQPPVQTPALPSASSAPTMSYPYQMSIPAPMVPRPPTQQRGTSTAAMASPPTRGAQLPSAAMNIGGEDAHSLSHPSGYQQNVNASRLDQYQRSTMERSESDDGENGFDAVWGAAKKLAQQTGERLVAAESELWKKINNE
ncbi:hypothetical protein GGS21DRAFT_208243 [Xylaria nigripes]|nr:hypothetical protein GGS21DRAFT_208243 [Xylaria nigripes]